MFISFEGIDGSGKSTQAKRLVVALQDAGHKVLHTREPGGSEGAEAIRSLVLEGATDRWSVESELLLFTAARRDHLEKTIWPALKRGEIVICDRFADSTRVFQGATRGDLRAKVDLLHVQMIGVEPDMTLLFDMDPKVGLARAKGRQTVEERFEDFGLEFQQACRTAFLELAKAHDRFEVIDADREMDVVSQDVLARVLTKVNA